MSKSKYLLKNIGILTISNFASKILVFLLVPLYTSVLTTAEYGAYDLASSMVSLFLPILTLNIDTALLRYVMDRDQNKNRVVTIASRIMLMSIAVFAMGMLVMGAANLWPDIHGLEIYVAVYYAVSVFQTFVSRLAQGLERVKDVGVVGVLGTCITLTANIFFLLVLRIGIVGFFLSNILSGLVSGLVLCVRMRVWEYIDFKTIDQKLQKEMVLYSLPVIACSIGWWVNSASDKYVVAFLIGVSANGLLSVAYKIPQIINILQSIFIQAWSISAVKEYGDSETADFYGNTFNAMNLLMCVACAGLIFLTRPLASFLFAKDFYAAWQYVPFLLISCVLNSAAGVLGPILTALKDTKTMMWAAIISAVINVILNIVFVKLIGIQGATIATVFCSYIIYYIRRRGVRGYITIQGERTVYVTWGILCAQAAVESYIGNYVVELVCIALLLFVNRNLLKATAAYMTDHLLKRK